MKKKVAFIILHYKNITDTIECIESLKKINRSEESAIVVVDNNSLNNKDEEKIRNYTKDLILLNENIGFAKGNNTGCKLAIEKYKPEFLCVINNDIVINQKDFIEEIYKCYQKTNFDIMGPKIITDGGDSVNPFPVYSNLEEVIEKINYHKKLITIYNNIILRNFLKIYLKIKHIIKRPKKMENGLESKDDIALHGCALIFSKKYYQKYEDVFYPETFLYHEEEFLNYRKNKDHLISYYDKDLEVFHKEGSSLNESFNNQNYKKLIFRNKEIIKSLELFKKVLEEDQSI